MRAARRSSTSLAASAVAHCSVTKSGERLASPQTQCFVVGPQVALLELHQLRQPGSCQLVPTGSIDEVEGIDLATGRRWRGSPRHHV